jgi:hypothetical protein
LRNPASSRRFVGQGVLWTSGSLVADNWCSGMPRFMFWNLNSLHGTGNDRPFGELLASLVREHDIEVVLLAEPPESLRFIHDQLRTVGPFAPVASSRRFGFLTSLNTSFVTPVEIPVPNDRMNIFRLSLPLQLDVTIAVIHAPDRRNYKPATQELFFDQCRSNLEWVEKRLGHTRTIVTGDFNVNPFEGAMGSVRGMHAVMTRRLAGRQARRIRGVEYGYFYNPMWNLYGDRDATKPPGTYYFSGGDTHEIYWHMLDQVIVRPVLGSMFKLDSLRIVTYAEETAFCTAGGLPDRLNASDHFPIVFELDLRAA